MSQYCGIKSGPYFHLISFSFQVNRLTLLKYLFQNHALDGIDFEVVAVKTEGFVVHDIIDFYNKTIFETYKEGNKTRIV